jgi:hypothetical protein
MYVAATSAAPYTTNAAEYRIRLPRHDGDRSIDSACKYPAIVEPTMNGTVTYTRSFTALEIDAMSVNRKAKYA